MRTAAQIDASRRNALRSTGPRTPAGKAVCRGNAIKHGLRSNTGPAPDPRMIDEFTRDFHPATPGDIAAVYCLAAAFARMQLVKQLIINLTARYDAGIIDHFEYIRGFVTLNRYDSAAGGSFHRALDVLMGWEKNRPPVTVPRPRPSRRRPPVLVESTTSPAPFVQNRLPLPSTPKPAIHRPILRDMPHCVRLHTPGRRVRGKSPNKCRHFSHGSPRAPCMETPCAAKKGAP